jgi:hypothetical protein
MNFLDAWKAAKVGQSIKNEAGAIRTKKEGEHAIVDALVNHSSGAKEHRMYDEHLFFEWYLVREKHHIEMTWEQLKNTTIPTPPNNAKVSLDWEE